MSIFSKRYETLNDAQKQAVSTIEGPLLVVAGPGTGKTELLSMRAANILQKTDTLPENILLLTFTDSGANAMRERLSSIIGPDAYRVAIHTFHGFGTEIINQNREYFFNGAQYQPADDITRYELLESIFDTLDYSSPLASKNNGEYVYLSDTMTAIGELKSAGLSSDELLTILDANDQVYDMVERELSMIFDAKIHLNMLAQLAPLAQQVANAPQPALPLGITPMANILALSLAHMFDIATQSNKTNAITAWRNEWMEKDTDGRFVFKDRKRTAKLRAIAYVYFTYLAKMNEQGLYDYDDMVLNVLHTLETRADLRANIQEKFQYIMVDEFQDTNLAQLRLLFAVTTGEKPNVMAVGDDDQAIYSFQGADVNNIHKFREQYTNPPIIVLANNYRSVKHILRHSREVILQGSDRLENTIQDLTKELIAHHDKEGSVVVHELHDPIAERSWVASNIAKDIATGTKPEHIAVIARRHAELVSLVPYMTAHEVAVNYERRDNVLDNEAVQAVLLIATITVAIHEQRHDHANALMPELLAHPSFHFQPEDVWQLSLASYRNRQAWLETMLANSTFKDLGSWLLQLSGSVAHTPLEVMIDIITGTPDSEQLGGFESPIFAHYFSNPSEPQQYLIYLEALRTLRAKLREYQPGSVLYLQDFLHYIDMHEQTNTSITSIRKPADLQTGAVNLLTAHKSKGLEYEIVYVLGAVDSAWGEKVRTRSRLIGYPKNISIAPAGDTYTERLRLFYVAMTRAKNNLIISYASQSETGKQLLPAAFLTGTSLTVTTEQTPTVGATIADTLIDWRQNIANVEQDTMQSLLGSILETYKLSATHLNNFLDVTKGGPQYFLLNNLLHFPSAKAPSAQYGTAIHATLQRVHNEVKAGSKRPIEDVLHEFGAILEQQHLAPEDHAVFMKRGFDSLTKFLEHNYDTFSTTQKTELSFGGQAVVVGDARLTGSLDLVDITGNSIVVTDYKTGSPARDWKGKSEYEKIKLHHYRQQLMFYQLLVQNSRDYRKYRFDKGVLQFVEPDTKGVIHTLDAHFNENELENFSKLITGVWQHIMSLTFPDVTSFDATLAGIQAFEQAIIDKVL